MVILAIAIALGFLLLVRRFSRIERLRQHHDIAGPFFGTVGVIYAVLLAFVVIIVWQNFDQAKKDVISEASHYADLYRDAAAFPEPYKNHIRGAVETCVSAVVEDEWPKLASGQRSELTDDLFMNIWEVYLNYEPQSESERAFYSESIGKLNEAGELRAQRIEDASSGIHMILWFTLLAGGLITIAFTSFFGSKYFRAHMIMSALCATLISLLLFLALVLDYPFTGDMSIPPDAFTNVLDMIDGR